MLKMLQEHDARPSRLLALENGPEKNIVCHLLQIWHSNQTSFIQYKYNSSNVTYAMVLHHNQCTQPALEIKAGQKC